MDSAVHTLDRLARGLAYVVNPLVLPTVLFVAILLLHEAPPREIGVVSAVCLLFLTVLPLAVIRRMIVGGQALSVEVLRREARMLPFTAGVVGTAAVLAGLTVLVETARPLMLAVAGILCLNTALLAVVNTRWKISLHAAGVAGFATILLFVLDHASRWTIEIAPLLLVVPAVMWARVRTRAHTTREVYAGAAFGIVAPILELIVLVRIGLL